MAPPWGPMFNIGLYWENMKNSSCLKRSLDIWYVPSPGGRQPSLFK